MLRILGWTLILVCAGAIYGCGNNGGAAGGGTLNRLDSLPDADGDAFSEITPPDGIVFDPETALSLHIINTITRSQAEAAAGVQLPQVVSSSLTLAAKVSVKLNYPGDIEQRLPGSFPVGPFDLAFEVACPDSIEVLVTVVATAPIVGEQPVSTFGPYVFTQGSGDYAYSCPSIVTLTTMVDEAGAPIVDISVD
jgi:hypothetical protein